MTIQLRNGTDDIIRNLKYNDEIEGVSNPIKEGSTFVGWYTYLDGELIEFNFENAKMPANDLVIFAKYNDGVSVIFVSNDSTLQILTGIPSEPLPSVEQPTIKGYTFGGWYLDKDYVERFDLSSFPASDMLVYAKWIPNNITIKFDANGGNGTMPDQVYVYDSKEALSENLFTKTGYKFLGWAETKTAINPTYTNGYTQNIKDSGSLTLYAIWQKVTYTVTYIINGHGEQPGALKGVNSLPKTLPILIEEGYIFGGWYYDEALTNQAVVNTVIESNIILYAKWEEEKVVIPTPTEKIIDNINVKETKQGNLNIFISLLPP